MNPSLTKRVSVSKAEYWPRSLLRFYCSWCHVGLQKRKKKANYPAVQTSRLVNKLAHTVKHRFKTAPQPKNTEPSPTSLLLVGQKI